MDIYETDRRQIALHSSMPLVVFQNHVVVFAVLGKVSRPGHVVYFPRQLFSKRWQVVAVAVQRLWNEDLFQRMQVEVFRGTCQVNAAW